MYLAGMRLVWLLVDYCNALLAQKIYSFHKNNLFNVFICIGVQILLSSATIPLYN